MRVSLLLISLGWTMSSVSCAGRDPLGRVPVTGEVSVDGAPLVSGAISLEPASDVQPTSVGSRIKAGAFSIPRDKGPTPGTYRVRIYASGRVQAPIPPGGTEQTRRPMMERIPAEYNTHSKKTAVIRGDGANHLRFDVTTTAADRGKGPGS